MGLPDSPRRGHEAPLTTRERGARLWSSAEGAVLRSTVLLYAASRVVALAGAAVVSYTRPGVGVMDVLTSWDAGWYLEVVRKGYPAEVAERGGELVPNQAAFFPLFPLLVRAADAILPGGPAAAAIVVATLAGGLAAVLVALLASALLGSEVAIRAAALFCFAPGAFILSMGYAEGLMLAGAAACLLLLQRGQWVGAGVAAALAGATRPNGVVLVACCLWAAVVAVRRRGEWQAMAAPALAPLGALAFFAFLWQRTGEAGFWFRVQRDVWNERVDFGRATVERTTDLVRGPLDDAERLVLGIALVVVIAGVVLLFRLRLPGAVNVYTAGILLLSLGSETLGARPRFVFTAFPLVLAFAAWARGTAYPALLGASAAIMPLLLVFYSRGYFELIPGAPAP